MSTHHISAFDLPKAVASLCALIAIVAGGLLVLSAGLAGCEDQQETQAGQDHPAFTQADAAQEAGLTVYWLGPSFEAGGVLFRISYAEFPEGFAGVPLQGLEVVYSSQPEPAGSLDLQLFSRSDWDQVKDKVMNPRLPGVTRETVTVAGREAELISVPLGTRPVNTLWLLLDLGDVVVLATAGAGGAVYPGGPDYNPFIKNPDLFVQVMEDLRPYPE